jgi:glycosyltransferase involved in cell wall biosynthesis
MTGAVSKPLKICIVTGQMVGPLQQGGIGTATTGLAKLLAASGHHITLLYTRGYQMSASQMRHWSRIYAADGINIVPLDTGRVGKVRGPMAALGYPVPQAVLGYLLEHPFDIVHLNDLEGEGFLAVAARACGIAFPGTVFVTGLHSPTKWIETLNKERSSNPVTVVMDAAERFQIRHSDVLWGPSRYLIEWIGDHSFGLPANTEVQQYVLPTLAGSVPHAMDANTRLPVTELVLFGRMEERKGIFTFLDAIDLLKDELKATSTKVLFLGPHTIIDGQRSEDIINKRGASWPFKFEIIGPKPHREALDFLANPGRLAIMASPEDNSPCTIYEAMELGIPFIAASGGGIPELIKESHRENVLFAPDARSLGAALRRAIAAPPPVPEPVFTQTTIKAQWLARHQADGWMRLANRTESFDLEAPAYIGLLIDDAGSAAALARTIASFKGLPDFTFRVIISKRSGISVEGYETIPPSAAEGFLSMQPDVSLLCVTSGFELQTSKLERLRNAVSRFRQSILLPSIKVDGQEACAPALSPATAYVHGPTPTGSIIIGSGVMTKLPAEHCLNLSGPFAGLADRAIASGAEVVPYPDAIGSISRRALANARPLPTVERRRHYANLPPIIQDEIELLTKLYIAGSSKPSGRTLWLRLIASPFGFLAPWVLEAGRRLRLTKR